MGLLGKKKNGNGTELQVVDRAAYKLGSDVGYAPITLNFQTTDDIQALPGDVLIGQPRVEQAFNVAMDTPGHLFIVAPSMNSALQKNLEKCIAKRPVHALYDTLFVHNAAQPEIPMFFDMEQGTALRLKARMNELLEALKREVPYQVFGQEFIEKQQFATDNFNAAVRELDVAFDEKLAGTKIDAPSSLGTLMFALRKNEQGPMRDSFRNVIIGAGQKREVVMLPNGRGVFVEEYREKEGEEKLKQVPPHARTFMFVPFDNLPGYDKLSDDEKEVLKKEVEEKTQELRLAYTIEVDAKKTQLNKDLQKTLREIRANFTGGVFDCEAAPLIEEFGGSSVHGENVRAFVQMLREHTIKHMEDFAPPEEKGPFMPSFMRDDIFAPFEVNVFVNNKDRVGVPIVKDLRPTWKRLFGGVQHKTLFGAYYADHRSAFAGDISKARGGYLFLSARDVILAFSWERLEKVLMSGTLNLEESPDPFGFIGQGMVAPIPLPVDVTVVMVGDRHLYYLLRAFDPYFEKVFKVVAELDSTVERSEETIQQYAELIKTFCVRENLPAVTAGGVAKLLEHASRKTGEQAMLSLEAAGELKAILHEAAIIAKEAATIEAEHIKEAIEQKVFRSDLIRSKIQRVIRERRILLDIKGERVGCVNGLAVYMLPDGFSFGRPSRITANTYAGKGVVSIDREADMSGKHHTKGVLILASYLGWKYAQKKPLSLQASISFEQSYGGVDGDSASSTELYAILSDLSGLPIRQDIAITGSVNQKGEIQPIGGVNEKVEGFFDICHIMGYTGTQGVLIPPQNVKDLMLRDDVLEAIREGTFHLYTTRTIDKGMEVLTGVKAGSADEEGTVNYLVAKRLKELAKENKDKNEKEEK